MADILLIDDMLGVRRAVAAMLRNTPHTVVAVEGGAQGLALLSQRKFDLVITDLQMPEMTGLDVVLRVKAMPGRPLVIAMSGGGAGASVDGALRQFSQAADAFLEKPFEKVDLLGVLARLLIKEV